MGAGHLESITMKIQTLTSDNGNKFADHDLIDYTIGSVSYLNNPYTSLQRESNEHLNRLLRQYIPKSRFLTTLIDQEFTWIESLLNNRPRSGLGFKNTCYGFL